MVDMWKVLFQKEGRSRVLMDMWKVLFKKRGAVSGDDGHVKSIVSEKRGGLW